MAWPTASLEGFAAVNHETVVVAAGSEVHFAGVEIKSPTVSCLISF